MPDFGMTDESMIRIDQSKVNHAIHECLDRCYRKDAALSELAIFLDELKSVPGWRAREIHEVELALLTVLHGVLVPGKVPGKSNDDKKNSSPEGWIPPNRPK
jgi:hypothetical protein